MAYLLDPREPLPEGVRRVGIEQLDAALTSLDEVIRSGHEDAVHDVRKRCKKIRALARLVRDEIGVDAYRRANDTIRDAARTLSGSRDAQVLVEAFDSLLGWMELDRRSHRSVRAELVRRAEEAGRAVSTGDEATADLRFRFDEVRRDVLAWELSDDIDALVSGPEAVYRRGRAAFRRACHEPTVEVLHEWRKRVKYLWYHLRLLAPASPEVLDPLRDVFDELADLLGDDHDLAVLVQTIEGDRHAFGGDARVEPISGAARARRIELQGRAIHLGRQVYVEKPSRFADRLGGYWRAGVVAPES